MDSMKWYFHKDIQGTHLLFESFELADGWNLLAAYIFVVLICWTERGLTFYLDQSEYKAGKSRWRQVIIRTMVYGLATVFRLWYMLTTMYFNTGLFIVVIFALCSGQLVIEVLKSSKKTRYSDYVHPQYDSDKRNDSFEANGPNAVFVLDDNVSHSPSNPATLS